MNKFYILSGSGWGSTLFLILPICVLIFLFIHFKKKKEGELKENNRLGRRGRKDHIWQILKEYHKKKNQVGSIIEESFLFERPSPSEFHDRLVNGLTYIEKEDAKNKGIKFKKIKYPKRIPEIEDYFDALAEETRKLNQKNQVKSHKVEKLRDSVSNKKAKRKRYVIFYKTRQKDKVSPWLAIEVELVKQLDKSGKHKDMVVVNKELDVDMEFKWIAPMLAEKIEEKAKKKIEAIKRQQKENSKKSRKAISEKLKGIFSAKPKS